MMKKLVIVLTVLLLVVGVFVSGCGDSSKTNIKSDEQAKETVSELTEDLDELDEQLDNINEDLS